MLSGVPASIRHDPRGALRIGGAPDSGREPWSSTESTAAVRQTQASQARAETLVCVRKRRPWAHLPLCLMCTRGSAPRPLRTPRYRLRPRPDSVRSKTGVGRPATLRHEPRRDHELHLGRRGLGPRHLQARQISGRDPSAQGAAPTRLGAGSHEAEGVGCPREVPAQDRGPPGAPASERSLSRWRSARRPRMVGDEAQS